MKNKLQKIIVSMLMVNLLIISFAHAAEPAAPDGVTPKMLADAQKSQANCIIFRNSIQGLFNGQLKAIWSQDAKDIDVNPRPADVTLCKLAPESYPDTANAAGQKIYGDIYNIPSATGGLQTQIGTSTGISQQKITDAQNQDIKDQEQAAFVSKLIGGALNFVISVLNSFVLWVTAVAGSVFTIAVKWILASTLPDAISVGWTIVRDICNTLFILILIVIGMGTILRIKNYTEYGHLLGELVLMALLVNFSKVIAVTLIDFVNVLIKMFAIGNFHDVWVILYKYVNFGDLSALPNGWMSGLLQGLSKLLFSFVGLATFLALTGMLILRIVVLYILIIISPLAYTLDILPATKHYAHEWWSYFLKNLIWVPVALLIMDIGILLSKQVKASDSAFNIILVMAFFWGAVIAAEHMGAAGGKMIANYAEGMAHKTWETGDRWLAKGAKSSSRLRRATSYLSAGAAIKGWQIRDQKKEHEAYNVASGTRADQFNKIISNAGRVVGGKAEKSEFRKRAMRQEWLDEMKLNQTSDEEELKHVVSEGVKAKNSGEVAGGLLKLAHDGNINEIIGGTTGEKLQEYIRNLVDQKVMAEQDARQLGMDISRIAEDIGQWNFARTYEGDGHGGIVELGGLAGTESENKRQAILQSQMKKPNQQQLYRNTTRLGGGFEIEEQPILDPTTHQPVIGADGQPQTRRVVVSVQPHGRKMIENISDYSGFKTTGNKELKTYYMISASETMYQDNPEVWINTADEFLAKNDRQRQEAYNIATTTPERIEQGERFGMNAAGQPDYTRIREHVNTFMREKGISRDDFVKNYKNLANAVGIRGATAPAAAAPGAQGGPATP